VARRQLAAARAELDDAARLFELMAAEAEAVSHAAALCSTALRRGKKILFCGNGGSAAQAAHLAGELSGRFYRDRAAIDALALTENTAAITAIANDFGYDRVFDRQLEAFAHQGDVLVALTTSGRSPNMKRAIRFAKDHGMLTIGLTGERGREFARQCDVAFVVPSADTARIQEAHILLGHVLCARVEAELFDDGGAS